MKKKFIVEKWDHHLSLQLCFISLFKIHACLKTNGELSLNDVFLGNAFNENLAVFHIYNFTNARLLNCVLNALFKLTNLYATLGNSCLIRQSNKNFITIIIWRSCSIRSIFIVFFYFTGVLLTIFLFWFRHTILFTNSEMTINGSEMDYPK